jgi:ribosomal protein S18 acetylase RimI-like enzyme
MANGKTGEFWVIAVLPDYEMRGIGSKLLLLAEDWLSVSKFKSAPVG